MSFRPLERRARFVLAVLVATLCMTVLAPFVHAARYQAVCSVDGMKFIPTDATATHDGERAHESLPSHDDDHAAHCPFCMPAGGPPPATIVAFEPVQPLSFVQQGIPAARLASLVGAPLPARGPPVLS